MAPVELDSPLHPTRDFWLSCGHHLVDRDAARRLHVTDEFLKVHLARPELMPSAQSCSAERRLHDGLLSNPRQSVPCSRVLAILDSDARENWEILIAWRDHLLRHDTLEAAYLEIARGAFKPPSVFIDQIVHLILRNILDGCDDAFILRAAEMFFRPQELAWHDRSLVAKDLEKGAVGGSQHLSPLISLLDLQGGREVDVLNEANAGGYWARSDSFDTALDLTLGQRGLAAVGEVVARWISHFFALDVAVQLLTKPSDVKWSWYIGLDSEATRIGDAIWNGDEMDAETRTRLVGVYQLIFANPAEMIAKVRGEPVYLLMAMMPDGTLRLKPQNLMTGLPIPHLGIAN
ncbi:DUF6352 family protein [Mesorhizobium sp. LNHC209A00]|uniref:DUF6352 family protein n=1 Tax=Mesorhizobium TaxID=68287 RepID=UPI0003D0237D|nr:DUF6352 family protein [Mesorhizobium sp. LNHC209A00]ESY94362.1 hypothetical protein X738_24630 [Mesorhizobium sp. LNHC209A00]